MPRLRQDWLSRSGRSGRRPVHAAQRRGVRRAAQAASGSGTGALVRCLLIVRANGHVHCGACDEPLFYLLIKEMLIEGLSDGRVRVTHWPTSTLIHLCFEDYSAAREAERTLADEVAAGLHDRPHP